MRSTSIDKFVTSGLMAASVAISFHALAAGDTGTAARLVTDPVEVGSQTRDFEQSLSRIGLAVHLDCRPVVEITGSGRNSSHGAICNKGSPAKPDEIMLCDDVMLGELTLKTSGFSMTEQDVIEFTRRNCPTGP